MKPRPSLAASCALTFLLATLQATRPASAGPFTPPANNRVPIDFNAGWLYVRGDVANAQLQGFNDSAWTSVGLPHTTKFISPDDPTAYLGVSWYRKHFMMPTTYLGRKIFIQFGAAMQKADVWINGTQIALRGSASPDHVGGYLPFTVDATSLLNYGGADNVVAVRVDSTPNSNWAPGNPDPDFQYHGGLYRDVKLIITDMLHVTDAVYANKVAGGGIFITYPSISSGSATVSVQTDVLNENSVAETATVVSTLTDANSNVVAAVTNTISIPAGTDTTFTQSMAVASPNLWSPYNPYVYTMQTVVLEGAAAVDYLATSIGIRSIQWTHNDAILINGVSFKARGADFHQEIYGEANARPDRTTYYDVKRLKDAGFDFVRACHYPHDPSFYDACDQLGVLVMDSQPGWQFYNGSTPFDLFDTNTFQDCEDMIRRDRNHPCVILWETSLNESGYTTAWATAEQALAHAEYPGNQMFTSGYQYTNFDTFCANPTAGVRTSADPRPIIIDEYGDWEYGGNSSTSRVAREAPDTNLLVECDNWQQSMDLNLAESWFSADALWTFADYTGYLSADTKSGTMDLYRLPKFSYYLYQSQRDPSVPSIANVQSGPMVYIANTMQPNSPAVVRVFSNCRQVSLYTNGVLFATQSPDTTYSNLPHPPFTFNLPAAVVGTIRADAIITNGGVVASFSRTTPGTPTQIALQTEGTDPLSADGGDARLVFISVLDANGKVVPNATNMVNLAISGHGTILGPSSVAMKGGQLATWMQAGRIAGTMTLTATGTGLSPASLTLTNQLVPYIDSLDPLPMPATPTALNAVLGTNSVVLYWAPAAYAFTYNVKTGTNFGGPFTTIASNITAVNYTTSLGSMTYYVVSAVNEAGVEGSNSAPVTAVTPIFTASLVNPGFETNTSGVVFNYKVSSGFSTVLGWQNTGTIFVDSGVDYAGDAGIVVHGGSVTAYCDGADSGAYQIVGYQLQAGDQVTLTWWGKGSFGNAKQNVKLLSAVSASSAYATLTQLTNSTAALSSTGNGGVYTQYTLNYTAKAADAGKYVAVSFVNSGRTNTYAMFDDFNLGIVSIPVAPGGLTPIAGNQQVLLTWNGLANATGYNVKRSLTHGGSYGVIATNLPSPAYVDTGLTNGTIYYYVVSALDNAGEGGNSAEVSAVPLPPIPAIPTGLTAIATNGQIVLIWNSAAYATGYNVFRSIISDGGFDTRLATNIPATTFTDGSAIPGTTYYYSVTGTNIAGQSDFSSQANATLPVRRPLLVGISVVGGNLVVNGTDGTPGSNYLVLTSTNLASPFSSWLVLTTNTFGAGGVFNFTNSLTPFNSQRFYLLEVP